MSRHELSRRRRIGWDFWDPIGIRAANDNDWRAIAAGEYDLYLLHVADLLCGGAASSEAAAYLDAVASDGMSLGPVTEARHAASLRTVGAIAEILREPPVSAPAPT